MKKILLAVCLFFVLFSLPAFAQGDKFQPVDIYSPAYTCLISGNSIYVTGNANLTGNLFSNSGIDLSGNSTITGDLSAVGTVSGKGSSTITGTTREGVPASPLPSLPDPSYFYNLADQRVLPKGTHKISEEINQVIYVGGDVMVEGNLSGTGTIIATGNIKVVSAQNGDLSKISLISYKDISLEGNLNLTALCYAGGCLKVGGNGKVAGSLVADSVKVSGNAKMSYQPLLTDNLLENMEKFLTVTEGWEDICKSAKALSNYGSSTTSWLISTLKNKEKDPIFRKMITEIIDQIKDPQVINCLLAILSDDTEDKYLRAEVIFTLGSAGNPAVYENFISLLSSPDDVIRSSVALSLGSLGTKNAVEPLINLLQDPDSMVRIRAIMSLGKLKDSRAVQPLVDLLQDTEEPNEDIQIKAIIALGDLGDPQAVPPLIELINTPQEYYTEFYGYKRIFATGALGKIGGEETLVFLLNLLTDQDELVILESARALTKMKEPRAINPLSSAIAVVTDTWVKDELKKCYKELTGREYENN